MISKSVLAIRFGLAKNKLRQAEANIFYPVCMIIDLMKDYLTIFINTNLHTKSFKHIMLFYVGY